MYTGLGTRLPLPHPHGGSVSSWDNILCLGVDVGSVDENLNLLGNDHLHVDMVVHYRGSNEQ